jgi:phage tail tape-measure protein
MTYEEMQRTMQFVLEQQAQLAANQQRADERADRVNKIITRISRTVDRLATATVERFERTDVRASAESEDVNAKLAALVDAQMRSEERMEKTGETLNAKFAALAESQMRTEEVVRRLSERGEKTDEAVRNLTDVVDRHLREHGNGERDVSR